MEELLQKLTITDNEIQSDNEILTDMYGEEILIKRFMNFKNMYIYDEELIKGGLRIRHQNTP